ncbi:MAG: hypothetical protein ACJAW4_000010 [Paracoccaceae bacterium]|jgi:hypothetical protein
MPLAFLGAIGGFFKGLFMGLMVVAVGIFALALLISGDRGAPAPVAAVKPVAGPEFAPVIAAAPGAPGLVVINAGAGHAPQLPQSGGASAPVSRLNSNALAALARADQGETGLADALASAPRPSSASGGSLAPTGVLDARAPEPIADNFASLSRATPSRLAALQDTGTAHGGFGAFGGQALTAVGGLSPARTGGDAAAVAGFAPPLPGAPPLSPQLSGTSPPPVGPTLMEAPGARMAALSPPGGMGAPSFDSTPPIGGSAPRLASPDLPSSRAPSGFGDDLAGIDTRAPMAGLTPGILGGTPVPGSLGGAPMIAPGQRSPGAMSPTSPQRIASLSPSLGQIAPVQSIAAGPALPGLRTPLPLDDGAPIAAGADISATRPTIAPAAPEQAAPEPDMTALRALVTAQTGGVPLPFARPPPPTAPAPTPVERLDMAAAPAPVTRWADGSAQPGLAARVGAPTSTPVTRLDAPTGAGPNATAPRVLGPGRLDDRRASSLVAAISTRPGSGVSAPRIVAAPGLSQTPGARQDQSAGTGFGGAQTSAPRPTFGAASPSLGAAGAPMTEDAPLVRAPRGGTVVASRGSDALQLSRPRLAALPTVGTPGRTAPYFQSAPDQNPPTLLPSAGAAATDAQLDGTAAGPLLALVLHGVDPMLAIDPAGPLAPLLAVNAPITLVVPQAFLTDPTLGARLRAMGVDLVIEADPETDLKAIAALGAVAVLPVSGDARTISMSVLRRFLSGMRKQGLALFNPAPGGGAIARMAMNMRLETVDSMQRVEIRSEANMAALRSSLDRAALDARLSGGAAIEIWATPAAIAEAASWFAATDAATAIPATVSALLQQGR